MCGCFRSSAVGGKLEETYRRRDNAVCRLLQPPILIIGFVKVLCLLSVGDRRRERPGELAQLSRKCIFVIVVLTNRSHSGSRLPVVVPAVRVRNDRSSTSVGNGNAKNSASFF